MAIHALVATIILLPLVITDIPLIADYPNHLARMHVLGNLTGNFFFQECCAVQFDFLPNLAMDLLVPVLAKLMPLPTAGQCFLLLTLISTLGSVALLHRVLFNLWSFYPLLAAFFLYHGSLMAGMVNFSLGIGLVPAALALWIAGRETSFARRLFLGSVVALVLYFCHLVALGIYALALLGYELMRMYDQLHAGTGLRRIGTDMAIAGATGILPLCLFVRLIHGRGQAESSLLDAATSSVSWGSWPWKAKALIAPLSNYNLPLDLLTFATLTSLAIWAWWSGRLIIERRMVASLGLLTLAFVLAPKSFWTGGVFDQRFAIAAALIFVASTTFRMTGSRIVTMGLPAALATLFLLRLSALTLGWLDHREDVAEMRSAIGLVPPGSRILVATPDDSSWVRLAPPRHKVFHHAPQLASLPTLAVIERSAFVSTLYALPSQHSLQLKKPYQHLGGAGSVAIPTLADLESAIDQRRSPGSTPKQIQRWRQEFDFVLLIYAYGPGADALKGNLPLVPRFDGKTFDLFEIAHP